MEYKTLGAAGPKVSRLCLGSNNFGRQLDATGSSAVIAKALDLGINMIDTADIYTGGRSEEIIGDAVKGNRGQVLLATKVGMPVGEGPDMTGLSRKHIEAQISESLRRLKTDHIDLYYMHRFDPDAPLDETMRALDELVKQNKVRQIGASNFTTEQLEDTLALCERLGLAKPVALQPQYSMLSREPEDGLLPLAKKQGLSVFAYSPLWGGFLTGKYSKGLAPPPGSRAQANPRYLDRLSKEGDFGLLDRLKEVADNYSVPLSTLALSWILRNPAVTAPVVGASTPDQVAQNCALFDLKLPDSIYSELELVLSGAAKPA